MPRGIFGQQVGRRLPDALPEAVGRRLELPGLHLRGDPFGLVQRGFPGLHGGHGLQGRRRPLAVAGRRLGEHVAHEMHHAPLVPRLRQHRVHRGDQSRAPVADHEPDALQSAFDHAAKELLPAGEILPHALGDADDLAVTILADADGDEDADVLHASAPGALVPHAVHEHVWVLVLQRPRAPFVDLGVHALELVAQCLGRHAVSPQQLADVVDLPGGHAGQVHVDQRLLYAFLASAVAFDHRGLEQGALQFRHLELEPAGLGGQAPLVVAGSVRPSSVASLVSRGVGDLVRLGVEHRVDDPLDLLSHHDVELALEHGLVELYDFLGHGSVPLSNRGFHCLATENRTRHGPCPFPSRPESKNAQEFGRYRLRPPLRQIALDLQPRVREVGPVPGPRVLRAFEQRALPGLGLADLVDGLVGVFDDMEPVDGFGRVGQAAADALGESQAHVARHCARGPGRRCAP